MDGLPSSTAHSLSRAPHDKPFITVLVLVTGVVGGLVIVISVILFCKYCIKHNKILKRNPVHFGRSRSPACHGRRKYQIYESLDLTLTNDVASNQDVESRDLYFDSGTKNRGEDDDEECNIDYAVRKYKESLQVQEEVSSQVTDDSSTLVPCGHQQPPLHTSTAPKSPGETAAPYLQPPSPGPGPPDPPGRRVSFLFDRRASQSEYKNTKRRFTDGDFQNLKLFRQDRSQQRMIKQKTYSGPSLDQAGHEARRQPLANLRRAFTEVTAARRGDDLDPYGHVMGEGSSPRRWAKSLGYNPPEGDLLPAAKPSKVVGAGLKDKSAMSAKPFRTEVSVEVHREAVTVHKDISKCDRGHSRSSPPRSYSSNTSSSGKLSVRDPRDISRRLSRGEDGERFLPPKHQWHAQSLELVSPTERLSVKYDQRRVKSYDGDIPEHRRRSSSSIHPFHHPHHSHHHPHHTDHHPYHPHHSSHHSHHSHHHQNDHDRLEITEFNQGPFYDADYDVMCEGRSPELRSKVRYNDTGSFEEVGDDDDVRLLEDLLTTTDTSDDTETLNGAQKYRELWSLRATFEEEEDYSDTIPFEERTSMEDDDLQSLGEEEQGPVLTSVTTSFESNTDPHDHHHHHPHHHHLTTHCHRLPSHHHPNEQSDVKPGSANLLHPNYESRRETYRSILSKRLKRIEAPNSTDNSFDSVETDGDLSDTSRPEQTTTSFESTTDNTDSTGERETHRLQQMRGDSGYKSLETQQTLPAPSQSPKKASSPADPGQEQLQLTGDQHNLLMPSQSPEDLASSSRKVKIKECATISIPVPQSLPASTTSQQTTSYSAASASRRGSHLDRRSARTASKKRREYSRERQQTVHAPETGGGGGSGIVVEPETDSRSDHMSGDSFDETHRSGKLSVFSRFFRSHHAHSSHKRGFVSRDYSIDEKTNAIFVDFVRHDPHLEGRSGSVSSSSGTHLLGSRVAHPYIRHRSFHHRKSLDHGTLNGNGRHKLSLDMRSVSLGSDSSTSSVKRLSPQDSIEEEDYEQLSPVIREHIQFTQLWGAECRSGGDHRSAGSGGQNGSDRWSGDTSGHSPSTIKEIPIIKLTEDDAEGAH